MFKNTCSYLWMRKNPSMLKCTSTCAQTCTHSTCTHTYLHTHFYTHTHTHRHIPAFFLGANSGSISSSRWSLSWKGLREQPEAQRGKGASQRSHSLLGLELSLKFWHMYSLSPSKLTQYSFRIKMLFSLHLLPLLIFMVHLRGKLHYHCWVQGVEIKA